MDLKDQLKNLFPNHTESTAQPLEKKQTAICCLLYTSDAADE